MSAHHRNITSSMHQSASAVNLEEVDLEVEIDTNRVDSDVVAEDELALLNEEDEKENGKEKEKDNFMREDIPEEYVMAGEEVDNSNSEKAEYLALKEEQQKQIDEQSVNGQNLKKRGNKPKRNYGKKRKKASDEQTRKPVNLKKMFSSMVPEK